MVSALAAALAYTATSNPQLAARHFEHANVEVKVRGVITALPPTASLGPFNPPARPPPSGNERTVKSCGKRCSRGRHVPQKYNEHMLH